MALKKSLEAALEKKCVDYAIENGCLHLKGKGAKDWPDQLFFLPK